MTVVRVLEQNVYVDENFSALPESKPGDVIDVAGGWYVDELVKGGLVELVAAVEPVVVEDLAPVAEAEVETKAVEAEAVKEPARVRRSR